MSANPVHWDGSVVGLVTDMAGKRLQRAAYHLENQCKKNLSKQGTKPSRHSAPGEFPYKQTGHLRRNVNSEYEEKILTARVGTNVPYGKHLEFGTRKMKARPWLKRTVDEEWSQLEGILKKD